MQGIGNAKMSDCEEGKGNGTCGGNISVERCRNEIKALYEKIDIAERRIEDFDTHHKSHRERMDVLTHRLDMVREDISRQGSELREHRTVMNQQYSDLIAEVRAGRVETATLASSFGASRVKSVIRWQWTMMVVLTIFGIFVAIALALGLDLSELIKLRLGM